MYDSVNSVIQPISKDENHISFSNSCDVIIVFTCQPTSHPFQERRVSLKDSSEINSVKIGRLVAKLKPNDDNAIFDCKVLSRNHAVMWTDDEQRVWMKDTRSSNGTFVNSQRLSQGNEESLPREIISGDIIQFGVEVMENHTICGCIITQVTILDSNGSEIKRIANNDSSETALTRQNIYSQEQVYQLSQYLQEALFREKAVERKTEILRNLLSEIEGKSETTWQVLLNEERLLSKIRLLENQLDIFSSEFSDDSLRKITSRSIEERNMIEVQSEELLNELLQEKLKVLEELNTVELQLKNREEDCSHIQKKYDDLENQFNVLTESCISRLETENANLKLQEASHNLSKTQLAQEIAEKEVLKLRVNELQAQIDLLNQQLDSFEQPHNEQQTEHLLDLSQPPTRASNGPLNEIQNQDAADSTRSVHEEFSTAVGDDDDLSKKLLPYLKMFFSHAERRPFECPVFADHVSSSICDNGGNDDDIADPNYEHFFDSTIQAFEEWIDSSSYRDQNSHPSADDSIPSDIHRYLINKFGDYDNFRLVSQKSLLNIRLLLSKLSIKLKNFKSKIDLDEKQAHTQNNMHPAINDLSSSTSNTAPIGAGSVNSEKTEETLHSSVRSFIELLSKFKVNGEMTNDPDYSSCDQIKMNSPLLQDLYDKIAMIAAHSGSALSPNPSNGGHLPMIKTSSDASTNTDTLTLSNCTGSSSAADESPISATASTAPLHAVSTSVSGPTRNLAASGGDLAASVDGDRSSVDDSACLTPQVACRRGVKQKADKPGAANAVYSDFHLSRRSRMLSALSVVSVIVFLLAIMIALYLRLISHSTPAAASQS